MKGIVVNGRRLQWLHGCSGLRDRLARGGGRISGERTPAAVRRQRTRRDRGTGRRDRGTDRCQWTAVTAVPQ